MESREMTKARTIPEHEGEDRISRLPDELIHKIYSFLDAKEAVQASVLSKRWKLIWTTLPSLAFGRYGDSDHYLPFHNTSRYAMFIRHVLSNRNHQSYLSELKMFVPRKLTVQQSVSRKEFCGCVVEKFIQYAILHNVECLNICLRYRHKFFKLSAFSSKLLKKLTLQVQLEICKEESDCWILPALTSLHLKNGYYPLYDYSDVNHKVPESWLTSLPALKTLYLDFWDLRETPLSLPNLRSLRLECCRLPETVWDLPSLLTLHLSTANLTKNISDMFSAFTSLRNLTLILGLWSMQQDHIISCPQLLNLTITTNYHAPDGNIVVSSPLLCNFTSSGIFSITFEVPELENVDIKLEEGWFKYAGHEYMKYYQRFTSMLSGLGIAKNLSFDLESIEVLAKNSIFLASFSSPFHKLKCVKLPKEYRELSIPTSLRKYLLSGSPGATIVTSLARKNRIPETRAVSVDSENVVLVEPLAAPTKELGDCQYINKTVTVDTVNTGVEEQHVIENSLVDANRARQTDLPVGGVSNGQVNSIKGNRDFGLWQGHEVNSEFVCVLDRIMHKYPETFEHFTTKNKKFGTMNLNLLCTSLNDLAGISLKEVNPEMIVEYRDVFAYLHNQGFNVSWLVNRLNYIEHLRFSKPLIPELHAIDSHIDDAKSKLQDLQSTLLDLQAVRMVKMTEIQNAFGTMGTNLAAGFIGDDLLSDP